MPDQQQTTHWQPTRDRIDPPKPPDGPPTKLPLALWRGLRGRCPGCGQGRIFTGYLSVCGPCPICRTPLADARADDAPPYFTILVVGHLIIPTMLLAEHVFDLGVWSEAGIFVPLTAIATVGLLRPIKGATVALMLHLNMQKSDS